MSTTKTTRGSGDGFYHLRPIVPRARVGMSGKIGKKSLVPLTAKTGDFASNHRISSNMDGAYQLVDKLGSWTNKAWSSYLNSPLHEPGPMYFTLVRDPKIANITRIVLNYHVNAIVDDAGRRKVYQYPDPTGDTKYALIESVDVLEDALNTIVTNSIRWYRKAAAYNIASFAPWAPHIRMIVSYSDMSYDTIEGSLADAFRFFNVTDWQTAPKHEWFERRR